MASIGVALGCAKKGESAAVVTQDWWVSGVEDRGVCADVGTVRACWDEGGAGAPDRGARRVGVGDGVALRARPTPARAASTEMGWRCAGGGARRACRDRARDASAFVCAGSHCRQRPPRMPDDGDWSCADMSGAVVCVGGAQAAGVAPVAAIEPPAIGATQKRAALGDGGGQAPALQGWRGLAVAGAGWWCGERRTRDELGEATGRICVDLSPDFPDGEPGAWSCRFENAPAPVRVCARSSGPAPALGGACASVDACPRGAFCVSGRCLPPAPRPACWSDPDCGAGEACQFGSCRRAGS